MECVGTMILFAPEGLGVLFLLSLAVYSYSGFDAQETLTLAILSCLPSIFFIGLVGLMEPSLVRAGCRRSGRFWGGLFCSTEEVSAEEAVQEVAPPPSRRRRRFG